MDTTHYQYINYPEKDSEILIKNIQERLLQSGIPDTLGEFPDSVLFSKEVKKYQASHKLKKDGKIGPKVMGH